MKYDRTRWWRVVLSFQGSVLPAVLGRVGLLTGVSLILCFIDKYLLEEIGYPLPALDQLGHTVLGVALSMLIVFRTNSSNSRYWEGRAAWGAIVNGSRNLARLATLYASPADQMANLITAYAVSIRENLRGSRNLDGLTKLISSELVERMKTVNNPPTVLAIEMGKWIHQRLIDGRIDSRQAMTMELTLNAMVDSQGACERIARTPLPFVYASLIKQILLLYLGSLPFVLVNKMGFASPLVVAAVSFGMLGIEEAGIEIENPFETTPNSLPLEEICTTIARDSRMICEADSII